MPWAYYHRTRGDEYVWGRQLTKNIFMYGDEEIQTNDLIPSVRAATQTTESSFTANLPKSTIVEAVAKWSGLITRFATDGRRVLQLDKGGGCHFVGGYDGYGIAAAVRSGEVVRSVLSGASAPSDFPLTSSTPRTVNGGNQHGSKIVTKTSRDIAVVSARISL